MRDNEDDEAEDEEKEDDDIFKGCEAIIQEEDDEDSQNESFGRYVQGQMSDSESPKSYGPDRDNKMSRRSMEDKIHRQKPRRKESAAAGNNSDNNYAELDLFSGSKALKNL